jgi:hypothetical protein
VSVIWYRKSAPSTAPAASNPISMSCVFVPTYVVSVKVGIISDLYGAV